MVASARAGDCEEHIRTRGPCQGEFTIRWQRQSAHLNERRRRAKGERPSPVMLRRRERPFPGRGGLEDVSRTRPLCRGFLRTRPVGPGPPRPHGTEASADSNPERKIETGRAARRKYPCIRFEEDVHDNCCPGHRRKWASPSTPGATHEETGRI